MTKPTFFFNNVKAPVLWKQGARVLFSLVLLPGKVTYLGSWFFDGWVWFFCLFVWFKLFLTGKHLKHVEL